MTDGSVRINVLRVIPANAGPMTLDMCQRSIEIL